MCSFLRTSFVSTIPRPQTCPDGLPEKREGIGNTSHICYIVFEIKYPGFIILWDSIQNQLLDGLEISRLNAKSGNKTYFIKWLNRIT